MLSGVGRGCPIETKRIAKRPTNLMEHFMEISVSRDLDYSGYKLRLEHDGQLLLPLFGLETWRFGQAIFSHCRMEHRDG